jgi:hypothetical protein
MVGLGIGLIINYKALIRAFRISFEIRILHRCYK